MIGFFLLHTIYTLLSKRFSPCFLFSPCFFFFTLLYITSSPYILSFWHQLRCHHFRNLFSGIAYFQLTHTLRWPRQFEAIVKPYHLSSDCLRHNTNLDQNRTAASKHSLFLFLFIHKLFIGRKVHRTPNVPLGAFIKHNTERGGSSNKT